MSPPVSETQAATRALKLEEAAKLLRKDPADARDLVDGLVNDPLFTTCDYDKAHAHCLGAYASLELGEIDDALRRFDIGRKLLDKQLSTDPISIWIENGSGAAWHQLGRYAEADRAFESALAHARRSSDAASLVRSLVNYGYIKTEAGRNEDALGLFTEALEITTASILPGSVGKTPMPAVLGDMGLVLFRLGRIEEARSALDRSISAARRRSDFITLAGNLATRAETWLPNQLDLAEEDLSESLSICLRHGANLAGVRTALSMVKVTMDMGNLDEAESVLEEWTPRAARCDSFRHAQLTRLKGRLLSLRGRWEEAYVASEEAGELERKVGFASLQSALIAADHGKLEKRTRKLAERIEGWNESVTLTLASLIEARDAPTGSHVERTQDIVRIMGEWLIASGAFPGFTRNRLATIVKSTPLHDIGKIAITDQVLRKPGPLTSEERAHIEEHTILGKAILLDAAMRIGSEPRIMAAAEIAGYHHERWDGAGYPEGLKAEAIPLSARIVAVADVYDAMRSPRPYKPALPHEAAREYIAENSGNHFDPFAVSAFLARESEIAALYA